MPNRSIYTLCVSEVGFLLLWSLDTSSSGGSRGSRVVGRGIGGSGGGGYRGGGSTIYS